MLRTALEFLSDELNAYLKRKDPVNFGTVDAVVLSGLMKPDGAFALPSSQGDENFRVIVTLINLEEDRIADSQSFHQRINDRIQVVNPPVNINAYVLFSVLATNYLTSLRLLSYVISFFQANRVFDSVQHPHLNAKVAPGNTWQKIGKLLVTMHPVTLEQQNNLWAALGAKYMPSLIYKIRTISFTDQEPKMEAPPVTEVVILSN